MENRFTQRRKPNSQRLLVRLGVGVAMALILGIFCSVALFLSEQTLRLSSADHFRAYYDDHKGSERACALDLPQEENRREFTQVQKNLSNKLNAAWALLIHENSSLTSRHLKLSNAIPRQTALFENDITLLTHGSVGRLNRILSQIDRWAGPVSVSLFVSSAEDLSTFLMFAAECNATQLENTNFHLYLEFSTTLVSPEYPHNKLRNLLMHELETKYFLALDADFVTEKDCNKKLKSLIAQNTEVRDALRESTFLVLPAFEAKLQNGGITYEGIPESKLEVISLIHSNTIVPFNMDIFKAGHGPTDFEKWLQNDTDVIYDIQYGELFEPYVLGRNNAQLPLYWERFRGLHFNKLSWFWEANSLGFRFAVLRDAFVYHVGVSGLNIRTNLRVSKHKRRLWKEFMQYIKLRYENDVY